MKRNEKILAGALGLFVVGYLALPMLDSLFFEPIRDLEGQVETVQGEVGKQLTESANLRKAAKQLGSFSRQSLPGNPLDAQRLYQQWLIDVAAAAGLDRVSVTPGRRALTGKEFTAVQIVLEGEAGYDELTRFLARFREADLLHRIVRLSLNATTAGSDGPLRFNMTAEGLALTGQKNRDAILPQTALEAPLAADGTTLQPAEPLPAVAAGNRLRIGSELLAVTAAQGTGWTVERGAAQTRAQVHAVGAGVEWFRMNPDLVPVDLSVNPFAKPREYRPKIEGLREMRVVRGGDVRFDVKVADYNRKGGTPTLRLADAPAGAQLDAATGTFTWKPGPEVAAGKHSVKFVASVSQPATTVEQTVTITLADPNTAPTFGPMETVEVLAGDAVRLPILATDAEDGGNLRFSLEGAPDGASISAADGVLRWEVPGTFTPGDTTLTVVAADRGTPPLSTKATVTVKVQEDLRPFVFLVGSIANGIEREAWLYDRAQNRRTNLIETAPFDVAGLSGTVLEIGTDFIRFERGGIEYLLTLGRHLGEAKPLTQPAKVREPVEAPRPAVGP